jgi:fructose-1,6-bisphosphatase
MRESPGWIGRAGGLLLADKTNNPTQYMADIMSKIFAVGDIHGSFDQLEALMKKIPIDLARDTLVFIGDYIDRGPASIEVVDYLIDLKKRFP